MRKEGFLGSGLDYGGLLIDISRVWRFLNCNAEITPGYYTKYPTQCWAGMTTFH